MGCKRLENNFFSPLEVVHQKKEVPHEKKCCRGFSYAFNYTDHLGNVRLTYSDSDGDGFVQQDEIISEKHYYPFGLQQKGYNNTITANANSMAERFAYNGKENNPELGLNWMDFSARNYDPALGRWMNLDPLAELMTRHSPYNFAFDNPIFFVDPDGMMPCDPSDPNCQTGGGPSASDGASDARSGSEKFVDGVKALWDYFTGGAPAKEKVATAAEAVLPDKLGLAIWDAASALPSSNLEVDVTYDGDFVAEAVDEAAIVTGVVASTKGAFRNIERSVANIERKVANVERKAANLSDDLVDVRHHTSPQAAKAIKNRGSITSSRRAQGLEPGVDVEVAPFGPARTASADVGAAQKGAFVQFRVPASSITRTPRVNPNRNTGRIITGGQPYSVNGPISFNRVLFPE